MKFFKIQIIILFLTVYWVKSEFPEYWNRIPTPTFAKLNRCIFTDTLNGWAAGDSGTVIHTSDGGASWVKQNSTIDFSISEIFFLNPRLGWCIANDYFFAGTMILRTTNGGTSWTGSRYPDTTYIINTVFFVDSLNGYLAGFNGLILKTTDAGTSWIRAVIGQNYFSDLPIRKISFYNSQYGIGCGGIMDVAGIVWRTTDSGYNWNIMDTTFEPLYDIKFADLNKILACGGDFEYGSSFSVSPDNGVTWSNRTIGFFGIANSIGVRNNNEFWAPLGFSRLWMYTLDSGSSWNSIPVNDTSGIFDVRFIDPNHGWACGENGSILKYNTLIGIRNIRDQIPADFELYPNYPNPFNPSTKIKFSIPPSPTKLEMRSGSEVKLLVYDILGREVATLVNEQLKVGTYEVEWDGSNNASGVYFYKLIAGEYSQTRKMILLK